MGGRSWRGRQGRPAVLVGGIRTFTMKFLLLSGLVVGNGTWVVSQCCEIRDSH